MSVTWRIGTFLRFYREIVGPASNPTNPDNQQLVAANSYFNAVCTLDNIDIFLGGKAWAGSSATLWRSQNAGVTWAESSADLPAPLNGVNFSIVGMFALSGKIYAVGHGNAVNDRILELNGTAWSILDNIGFSGQQPGSGIYVVSANEIYVPFQTIARGLRYYDGTWKWDSVVPTLAVSGGPIAIWHNGNEIFMLMQEGANPMRVYRGGFENWTLDYTFPANCTVNWEQGRKMWGDPWGNLYVICNNTGTSNEIYKRSVTSNSWSVVHTGTGSSSTGGIWGIGSSIVAGALNYLYMSDNLGVTWNEYNTNTKWGWNATDRMYAIGSIPQYSWTVGNPAQSTRAKEPLWATALAVGEENKNLRGYAVSRLRTAHSVGDTTLNVESVIELAASGKILLQGEPEPLEYGGRVLTLGAQQLTGVDPLTVAHSQGDQIVDWNRNSSKFDELRRATLIDYADDEDLDRVTRLETTRPRGFDDTSYRRLAKVLSYLPRCPIYAFELALDAIYPGGGYEIYESLIEEPGVIYITLPGFVGTTIQGRTFLNAQDQVNSSNTTTVTVSDAPTSVETVKTRPVEVTLDMAALPSAAATPWTYVAESAGAEGAYFGLTSGRLVQSMPLGTDCGKYRLAVPEVGEYALIEVYWQPQVLTTVGGGPWKLIIEDGAREMALLWSDALMALGHGDETVVSGTYAIPSGVRWHNFRLVKDGNTVYGYHNGKQVLSAAYSGFDASANSRFEFGYTDNGNNNEWTVHWDNLKAYTKDSIDYWNLSHTDGVLVGGSDLLTSAAALFVAGDATKRIWLEAVNSENYGLWQAIARPGATQLQLDGVPRTDGYADSLASDRFYSEVRRFTANDIDKIITIASGLNPGSVTILEVINDKEVRHDGTFVTETDISWKFDVSSFVNESSIPWTLVDAGTVAGAVLTLHSGVTLPQAVQPVEVQYTTALSAQILKDETEENAGTGGSPERYPAYLYGANERIQAILNDIKAAGIILKFNRGY